MQTTAKDLRIRTKEILAAAKRGEEIIVTHRGRSCAKIISAEGDGGESSVKRVRETPLFGIWKDNEQTQDVNGYLDKQRGSRF